MSFSLPAVALIVAIIVCAIVAVTAIILEFRWGKVVPAGPLGEAVEEDPQNECKCSYRWGIVSCFMTIFVIVFFVICMAIFPQVAGSD
jgi:hypothetical protein